MALLIQKFGGTSVGSIERIENVANRVIEAKEAGHDVVVVVSAMSGETNKLVALAQAISDDPTEREYDLLLSTGETVTIALLSMMLNKKGYPARSYNAFQARILTEDVHKKAHVIGIETENLFTALKEGVIPVVAGFQGLNSKNEVTTLGRGGSDATAVALAAAMNADECQVFTDVDGIFTADPRIIKTAQQLPELSYDEMLQMASLGAKVMQSQSIELACQNNVPLRVASSFTQHPGTLLCHHVSRLNANPVTAVVSARDVAKLTLMSVSSDPGFIADVLMRLAKRNVSVDMVLQNESTDEEAVLSLVVPRDESVLAKILLDEFTREKALPDVILEQGLAKLSLVGRGLSSHSAVMSNMFSVLMAHEIQIHMLTTSEIKISVLVNEEVLEIGVEALHNAFGLSSQT